MIYSGMISGHLSCYLVLSGDKTWTWRPKKDGDSLYLDALTDDITCVARNGRFHWQVGNTYAVQPGRGKAAVGRIKIAEILERRPCDIRPGGLRLEGFRGTQLSLYDQFRAVLEGFYGGKITRWDDVMEMPGYWLGFELVEGKIETADER